VESLTQVDYGLKMRDLLKEIVQLRLGNIIFRRLFRRRLFRNTEDALDDEFTGTITQPCFGGRVT
jgi:hypothetical protein